MNRAILTILIFCVFLSSQARPEDAEALSKEMAKENQKFLAEFRKRQSTAVEALEKINPDKIQLYLYSLDPLNRQPIIHDAPSVFYGYPILGRVEIKPIEEKRTLFQAFIQGVKESDGMEADCFEPRHGLRVIQEGRKTDFVICYSCLSVSAIGFGSNYEFLTSGTPMTLFNQYLDRYHLRKADPPR